MSLPNRSSVLMFLKTLQVTNQSLVLFCKRNAILDVLLSEVPAPNNSSSPDKSAREEFFEAGAAASISVVGAVVEHMEVVGTVEEDEAEIERASFAECIWYNDVFKFSGIGSSNHIVNDASFKMYP